LGEKEETVLNKAAIQPLKTLMKKHLNWHPFKFPSTMPILDHGTPLTSRLVWLRQANEMHAECKKYQEGFAWEYLWTNWYKWEKWQLWARAVSLEYYPIIQTNAPVETHWNFLKNRTLRFLNRIRLDHLCAEIHHIFLPLLIINTQQRRNGRKAASWHRRMVRNWKQLEDKISKQDAEDLVFALQNSIEPEAADHPAVQRNQRIVDMHHTDIQSWRCQCASFNYSPYHICSHLLRLYGQSYPLKGEAIRQHKPPLLYIADYHDENQKFHRPPLPNNARQPDPPVTLKQLGITQADLAAMECDFDESDPEPEEFRTEEDMRKYEEFLKESERAIAYARAEMAHSGNDFVGFHNQL
jgi:hypothetical protein